MPKSEPSTLKRSLDVLMAMEAPSIRRDPTPAKPGWFWCCFDDGVELDPSRWYADVGKLLARLGSGPYLLWLEQDSAGDWFGHLPNGGVVEFADGLGERMVRLSYAVTVAYQRSATGATVRITWLGEAIAPPMPEQIEEPL